MPRPSERTRSRSRIKKTLPGGNRRTDFREKTASMGRCGSCGRRLAGVSSMPPSKARKLNRGKRRVWRLSGGQLCHRCLKSGLKRAVRTLQ